MHWADAEKGFFGEIMKNTCPCNKQHGHPRIHSNRVLPPTFHIQGRPSPLGNDAFPPCFTFPPISEFFLNFRTPWKIFPNLTFSEKNSPIFIHQNFCGTFSLPLL